ncbi:MAG TPA: N-6 DNA methylase [Candidatus Acidoferrales bacterium]|nr:N-6 DNA methylase [Candidatus Acidoferrales bacterium]
MGELPEILVDSPAARKARGAYFTPPALANFLARWAIHGNRTARVLDPTCGEGVFLLAAARELRQLGTVEERLGDQVFGVDLHGESLEETARLLEEEGLDANVVASDFFELAPPSELFSSFGPFDAVIGNPPFVRYQQHIGQARRLSAQAALRQGVRLSGLASSWAALPVHAGAFLVPEGRMAMVLPAELLTVGYAEPVRQWMRRRFASVKLVFFERRQFADALENVVLVLAQGSGGCDAFSLYYVHDGEDLNRIQPFDEYAVTLSDEGKWSDLLLSIHERQVFKAVTHDYFVGLGDYGSPELGTVTGANWFFTLNEATRKKFGLQPDRHVMKICPPGTRHLRGLSFTPADWDALRDASEAVWILQPAVADRSAGLRRYLEVGESKDVPDAYKCQVRAVWWRPPVVAKPDLFFTYMSHRYPRLITNTAGVTFVNSMHGVRLKPGTKIAKQALPLLAMNSVTMLGAEIFGRSYGGGILKMEPREAAKLPLPAPAYLAAAWERLRRDRPKLESELRAGRWASVVGRVDQVLLRETLKLSDAEVGEITNALQTMRKRRISRDPSVPAGMVAGA